jgi:hypothetical protein
MVANFPDLPEQFVEERSSFTCDNLPHCSASSIRLSFDFNDCLEKACGRNKMRCVTSLAVRKLENYVVESK